MTINTKRPCDEVQPLLGHCATGKLAPCLCTPRAEALMVQAVKSHKSTLHACQLCFVIDTAHKFSSGAHELPATKVARNIQEQNRKWTADAYEIILQTR